MTENWKTEIGYKTYPKTFFLNPLLAYEDGIALINSCGRVILQCSINKYSLHSKQ